MIYFSNSLQMIVKNDHPVYNFSPMVNLSEIKTFVYLQYRKEKQQICIHEFGIDNMRFDFLSLNPYTHRIRIMEYKSCLADYLSDKKWKRYLPYCNTFTFVTPLGLDIDLDQGKEIGLLQIFKWNRRELPDVKQLGGIWVRKPRGKIIALENYYKISDMLLAKIVQGRKKDLF